MQWLWWLFGLRFYNLSIGCLFCCSCPIHDCWLLCGYSGPLEVQQKYVNAHQQYEVNSVKRFKKITYAFSENSNYGRERYKGKTLLDDVKKFVDNAQQCFALSKLSRPKFEFSLKVKVMRSNPGYLLKSSLLYQNECTVWGK